MEGQLQMVLIAVGVLLVLGIAAVVVLMVKRTAYLGPVKEELQKEKAWLRRGEYNAAMVKGRQNLELLLKLVAEKNGIQLDNTAKAQANAREMEERQSQNPRGGRKAKTKSVMTHKEFNRWLTENGYLDRVARWEMHQVRQIGNKAVHENYSDKEDAWNQFNYLEDILKVITEKSQSPSKRTERSAERRAEAVPKKQASKVKKEQPKKQAPKAKQEPAKKKEAPKPKQEPAKKKEAPKPKQEPVKKKEAPKPKQEQPKKQTPKPKQEPVKKQPEAAGSEQVSAEPAKKKHRRRRPKKKHTAENAAAEGKQATKEKQEQPKKEAPKPKQEQPASEQPKPKKKNNHNQYWRKRRKKKSSGQANANANANASAATAGSGGQE